MNNVETKVVGLNGFAQSGKDTVGSYLVENHGFVRVSFADAVRECVYALNPYVFLDQGNGNGSFGLLQDIVDEYGWEFAKVAYSDIRRLLQRMGTEVGRQIIDPHIWINIASRKARQAIVEGKNVVFTDVRFDNEVETVVWGFNGKVVRILRPGVTAVNGHSSDQPLPDNIINIEIANDGTLEQLYERIENFLTSSYGKV